MDTDQKIEVSTGQDTEAEDNIYVYIDEEEYGEEDVDIDDSPLNYAQIPEGVENYIEEEKNSDKNRNISVFLLLLKLLSNPVEGWKEVRREGVTVDEAQRNCFYPLLAIMAISHFATLFYSSRVTLSQIILEAVTSFVGYFAGFFCIILLLKLLLPKGADKCVDTNFGKVFVILNLSSLCLFFTAMELLPMLWPILIFLPLWTVYVICRGTRFFRFPEEKTILCIGLMCVLIVGLPTLIEWGLNEVLPTNV
ncbi:MAG: YIP1 family protein [Muribaculaceae bacterium]|nr:YIP1 family protein [Muribaculaceae bacterium]MDE6794067.1 YIP1 family protein [Muribaculaceae bacterium]